MFDVHEFVARAGAAAPHLRFVRFLYNQWVSYCLVLREEDDTVVLEEVDQTRGAEIFEAST